MQTDDCGVNFECRNTAGSFECVCNIGYELLDNGLCVDIDECATTTKCDADGQCQNTVGSYICHTEYICNDVKYRLHVAEPRNFQDALYYCESLDLELPVIEDRKATPVRPDDRSTPTWDCFKSIANGEYWLGISDSNEEGTWLNVFRGNNIYDYDTYWDGAGKAYGDHNGYSVAYDKDLICDHGCDGDDADFARTDANGYWHAEDGLSLYSTVCIKIDGCGDVGYELVNNRCYDIDECLIGSHNCDDNFGCVNNDGSFTCECLEGFAANCADPVGDDDPVCTCDDINECETECTSDTNTCTNTVGSYICSGELTCGNRIFKIDVSGKRNFDDSFNHCLSLGMQLPVPRNQLMSTCFQGMETRLDFRLDFRLD